MKLKKISLKQIALAFAGIIVLGLGIGWGVKVGIGVDSLSSLYVALSNILGMSVGTVTALVNLIMIVLTFFLYKKNLGIATFLFMFVSKWPIDFANEYFPSSDNFIVSLLLCILSIGVIALGSELFIFSDLGADAYIALTMAVGKLFKHEIKYVYIRWAFDGIILVIAYFLGGPIGIGTILSFIFSGVFMKWLQKPLEKILN